MRSGNIIQQRPVEGICKVRQILIMLVLTHQHYTTKIVQIFVAYNNIWRISNFPEYPQYSIFERDALFVNT